MVIKAKYMRKPNKKIRQKQNNSLDSLELLSGDNYLSVSRAKELYKIGVTACNSYFFKLKKEEHIFFYGQSYNAYRYVYKGISHKEDSYSWTDGKILGIIVQLVDYPQGSNIQAVFKLKDVFNGKQPIIANVNNKEVYKSEIKHGENISFDFVLPEDKIVDITIEFPDACSPLSLGLSEDTRSLALAIESIAFNLKETVDINEKIYIGDRNGVNKC